MPMKLISEYANAVRKYATPVGCIWYFVNFVFRYIIVSGIGKNVYSDAMKEFTCDTRMPGCDNVCHNAFLPIDMDRFWQLEMLFVCSPTLFFVAYSTYNKTKIDEIVKNDPESNDYGKYRAKQKLVTVGDKTYTVVWTPQIRMAFLIHLIIRICLEVIFIIVAYVLQTLQTNKTYMSQILDVWEVPEKYVCDHAKMGKNSPCWQDKEVICWVARPKEKTILVKYMLVMQLLSIFLTTLELVVFSCKWSMRLHLPEPKRPEFTKKVVRLHRYFAYDRTIVRRRPTSKDLWQGEKGATEDLLIAPSAPDSDITKCTNVTPIKRNEEQVNAAPANSV